MNILKAAAKTAAAGIVGWLGVRGIDIDGVALEVVLTGLFVGIGSILVNTALILAGKLGMGDWVARLLPSYESKT